MDVADTGAIYGLYPTTDQAQNWVRYADTFVSTNCNLGPLVAGEVWAADPYCVGDFGAQVVAQGPNWIDTVAGDLGNNGVTVRKRTAIWDLPQRGVLLQSFAWEYHNTANPPALAIFEYWDVDVMDDMDPTNDVAGIWHPSPWGLPVTVFANWPGPALPTARYPLFDQSWPFPPTRTRADYYAAAEANLNSYILNQLRTGLENQQAQQNYWPIGCHAGTLDTAPGPGLVPGDWELAVCPMTFHCGSVHVEDLLGYPGPGQAGEFYATITTLRIEDGRATLSIATIPEPSCMALLALGVTWLAARRRRANAQHP